MFFYHDIIHAVQFAELKHRGQVRKYTGEPYIVHLLSVAKMVASARMPDYLRDIKEDMVIAALLHDTVEDTATTLEEIGASFGSRVRQFVYELTDPPNEFGNRAARKEETHRRLRTASDAAKIIKCADIIDNMHSIVTHDPKFAKVFLSEIALVIPALAMPGCTNSLYWEMVELHRGFYSQSTAEKEGKKSW